MDIRYVRSLTPLSLRTEKLPKTYHKDLEVLVPKSSPFNSTWSPPGKTSKDIGTC